ncbi:MAG: hypothetical protein ABSE36_13310 [Terracidiphilus sp.]|jgi:hypothetical protein
MTQNDISEIVKNYAQVVAWAAGATYFIMKIIQGYWIVDMSVKVSLTRQHSDLSDEDYIGASVELVKGEISSVQLHDATLVVRQAGRDQKVTLPIQRFSFRTANGLRKINFDKFSSSVPTLNLAAGETATIGAWVKVNRGQPCVIEAVVIGTGFSSHKVGQWRASAVSLPLAQ